MCDSKLCLRCNVEKPRSEFNISRKNGDGLQPYCKDCSREYAREHYQRDLPKQRKRLRVKNATNGHRSGSLLAHATTRAKKHDLPITITRAWILERLDAGTCEATGLPFDTRPNEEGGGWVRRSFCPSLDRIDPAQGYTPENTQVVCWIYNAAKGTNGHEDVLILAEALCRK